MRIFITGGSGFIGGHIIEALAGEHEVCAMARSDEAAALVRWYGASPVRGQLGQVRACDLRGIDAVIHCAARAEAWGTAEQFEQVNVHGTRQLLEAAQQAGVSRFINIGTEAAFFVGRDLIGIDETIAYPRRHRFAYCRSKAEAEQLVLAANRPNFQTLSLRPRWVWGPRDGSVLPTLVDMVRRGTFRWIDHGRALTSTTYVGNLAHAVELALHRGYGGAAYFISDDVTTTQRRFLRRLLAMQDIAPPNASLPGGLARPLSGAVEWVWRLLRPGQAPPMTALAAAMMSRSVTVNIAKARAELGYRPLHSPEDAFTLVEHEVGVTL